MPDLAYRECPHCGVSEHVIAGATVICTSCSAVGEAADIGDCRFAECPDEATHLVVFNPVGSERQREEYCEAHAELAAEDAKKEPGGDLFLGPVPIDSG